MKAPGGFVARPGHSGVALRDLVAALGLSLTLLALWRCQRRPSYVLVPSGVPADARASATNAAAGPDQDPGETSPIGLYRRRAMTTEAVDRLAYIYRMMQTYVTVERASRGVAGALLQVQFPASAPLTPAAIPRGVRVRDPAGTWAHETWQALQFSISDPHAYSYEVVSDGHSFTARAYGDLDGDGECSTFERAGVLNAQLEVQGSDGLWMAHEYE